MKTLTWEQAVVWLREQPELEFLERACYFDDPLIDAADRFWRSEEWNATRTFLPNTSGSALDLGAGRGISSYALARDGWRVTALEPDPSSIVGSMAIRNLAQTHDMLIHVVEEYGENLPFDDGVFDLVYARQALHHAKDLSLLCKEASRVLRPGGRFLAVREHVISRPQDMDIFLLLHPLHKMYGGENAYLVSEYRRAILAGGLKLVHVLGPYDTVINYFPMTSAEWYGRCTSGLVKVIGKRATHRVVNQKRAAGRWILRLLASQTSSSCDVPGRLYSFIAEKPAYD